MDSNEFEYKNDHLVKLSDSDYEIVDGEPDIEGWDVKNELGQKIGDVHDLLFDPQSRKVRYIIVDLDDNELELDTDKKVLIPIGIAELYESDETEEEVDDDEDTYIDEDDRTVEKSTATNTTETLEPIGYTENNVYDNDRYNPAYDGDVVIIPGTLEQLRELPAYEDQNLTPEAELTIRRIFSEPNYELSEYNRNEFYEHDHFYNEKFYDRGATTNSIVPEEFPEKGNEGNIGRDL